MSWARYIRNAHINFLPLSEKPVALTFLNEISSAKVKSACPKLEVKATRLKLPRPSEAAPQCVKLTFVDEKTIEIDLNVVIKTYDIYAEIEAQNGRLEYEAMVRGKPWT